MKTALPLRPSIPSYRFSTTLEVYGERGETVPALFIVDMRWNSRAGSWFMDLLKPDETPIRYGMRVVLGAILGGRCASRDFPAGALMAMDLSGEGREATLDDIGSRVVVYYYTVDEFT